MTELHPCARCARAQRTCCQEAEILLTSGDLARIHAFTGREGFDEWRAPADPAYVEHDLDDPAWVALTVRDGQRRMLKRRPDGDCTFLGSAGCVLPEDVRPLVCRLYPWSYTERGIDGEAADYCPTWLLRSPHDSMTAVLSMARADGERWRAQLYAELKQDRLRGGVACESA